MPTRRYPSGYIDPELATEWRERDTVRHANAVKARIAPQIEAIRARRAQGMSRSRLEQIYGRDVVHEALIEHE